MTDSRNFAIGVLGTTAAILFVGLMLVLTRPEPARASGMGDRGGDYILLAGELWAQQELLYVINTAMDRMITYQYNARTGQIEVADGTKLREFMQGGAAASPPKGRSRGRGRP